ncbi:MULTISPECIES: methyltransferase domain-containing protein [unclassified Ruegeria]|uniref:methyltransferase domain-containing protein n=1 Tax=unclassified Ruegeria TaxID=2625375 RepID=UPI001487A353|nr:MULTISPECIES: methyltransferase domain-containing protein [unclassified Ruegeria]
MSALQSIARKVLPESTRRWITVQRQKHRLQWPRAGSIDFGDFDRLAPVSNIFGFDRGQAIDRYYIEAFLRQNRADITGRCLELGDPAYIEKYGQNVSQADVLHYVEGNPQATIVGDLTNAPHIPDNSFDCIIFTQTIQMIYEPRAAFQTLYRILKPGGVALITSAGIAKIGRRLGRDDWGEYWHFTAQSLNAMALEFWAEDGITIHSYGNVMTACAFLQGLAAEELLPAQLDHRDEDFEVIVTARLQKEGA